MAAFERAIKRLMAEQGVRSAAELHRLLIADGVEISYDRVRRYLSGGWRRSGERKEGYALGFVNCVISNV